MAGKRSLLVHSFSIGFFFFWLGLEVLLSGRSRPGTCRYLVKAVDSGESIRLQYRSLRKAGELKVQALLQSRQ